jgi:phosphatidate cytidylyltransferase
MLKTRIITGLFLIAVIFMTIFGLPLQGFILAVAVLSFFMMREWLALVGCTRRWTCIILLDLFVFGEFVIYWTLPLIQPLFVLASLFWLLILPLLCVAQLKKTLPRIPQPALLLMGYFSLLLFFAGLVALRAQSQAWVLMAFVIVWCSDSLAYVVGRMIGKHRLISTISPGKTWEGSLGAALLTLPLLFLYAQFVLEQPTQSPLWFVLMLFMVVFSVVGDLFESMIKRMHGVKDSGRCLPGHGGLLDRFDSLMAVAPVLACLVGSGWV